MVSARIALTCAMLGAASSAVVHHAPNIGHLTAVDRLPQPHFRGTPKSLSTSDRKHRIVALQVAQGSRLKAGTKRRAGRMQKKSKDAVARCRTGGLMLWVAKMRRKCHKHFGDNSRWDKTSKHCAEAWKSCTTGSYAMCCSQPEGPRDMKTYCAKRVLMQRESSGGRDSQNKYENDKACEVERKIEAVREVIEVIKETVIDIDNIATTPPPVVPVTLAPSTRPPLQTLGPANATPSLPNEADVNRKAPMPAPPPPQSRVVEPSTKTTPPPPAPPQSLAGEPATRTAPPPPSQSRPGDRPMMTPPPPRLRSRVGEPPTTTTAPSPATPALAGESPAAAPPVFRLKRFAGQKPQQASEPTTSKPEAKQAKPAMGEAPLVHRPVDNTPNPWEAGCAKLTLLTQQASEKISDIKTWATRDGIQETRDGLNNDVVRIENGMAPMPDTAEAKDPELVFAVKGIVSAGDKLAHMLKNCQLCEKTPASMPTATLEDDDADDDDDDDDEEEEALIVPEAARVTKLNESAVMIFLDWESSMSSVLTTFETSIHPHGTKWWRYRYEYTVLESFVLAFSIMTCYFWTRLLQRVSSFGTFKFYKTGLPHQFYRYSLVYFLFHAAALMLMTAIACEFYIPWGEGNIFDVWADIVREFVDGKANVPFLGISWLYIVFDVYVTLFACVALYALFTVFIFSNYIEALLQWKAVSTEGHRLHEVQEEEEAVEEDGTFSGARVRGRDILRGGAGGRDMALYRRWGSIMKKRVRKTLAYKQMFTELNLKLAGVDGLDEHSLLPDCQDFKLHVYLIEALGESAEYLTESSFTTSCFLSMSSLCVGFLAAYFQLPFVYFLPFFVCLGLCLGLCGCLFARHFENLSDAVDYTHRATFVTVHSCCRAIQMVLYCLFYSLSRLLLSNDIFESYPVTYLAAFLTLAILMIILANFAGEIVKELTCSLLLPPYIPEEELKAKLGELVSWHAVAWCYECGVEQSEDHECHSKRFAGSTFEEIGGAPRLEKIPEETTTS